MKKLSTEYHYQSDDQRGKFILKLERSIIHERPRAIRQRAKRQMEIAVPQLLQFIPVARSKGVSVRNGSRHPTTTTRIG